VREIDCIGLNITIAVHKIGVTTVLESAVSRGMIWRKVSMCDGVNS
jgi:hypothetical protein